MSEIPTFSECVIGYRAWGVDAFLRLWPVTGWGGAPWSAGVNEAKCGRERAPELVGVPAFALMTAPPGHSAPHQGCGCGLYSRRRLGEVLDEIEWPPFEEIRNPVLPGAVAVWGDLQVHRDGFRASHACIVALAWTLDMPHEIVKLARAVAHGYGVPLVHAADLEAEASKSGTPLPDEIAPPPEPPAFPSSWPLLPSAASSWAVTYSTSSVVSSAPMRRKRSRAPIYVNAAAVVVNVGFFIASHWWGNAICAAASVAFTISLVRRRRAAAS